MPKPKADFSGMEEEPVVVGKKTVDIWQELKKDPDLRSALVPIPDHGMVASILLIRIEKRLENMESAIRELAKK